MRNKILEAALIGTFLIGTFASTAGFAGNHSHGGGVGAGPSEQRSQRADQGRGDRDRAYQQQDSRSGERRDDRRERDTITHFFGDQHREISRHYFRQHYSDNRCPPGLAKKRNGCMPPGLAKKWSKGKPLPRNVIFHDLPPGLLEQFGTPPPRHRYARVDSDILLIEIGTGIVLDVIESLGW